MFQKEIDKQEEIKIKVDEYKNYLENESKCKLISRSKKAKKLLNKMDENQSIQTDLYKRVEYIINNIYEEDNIQLFYLDWNHIIYDTLKDKIYDEEYKDITSITPETLSKYNMGDVFYPRLKRYRQYIHWEWGDGQ